MTVPFYVPPEQLMKDKRDGAARTATKATA